MKKLYFLLIIFLIFFLASSGFSENGDTIHVCHYNISLKNIDTQNHAITAVASLTVVAKINTLGFTLDLKYLTVDSVKVDGNPVNYSQTGDSLHIFLPQQLSENDTISVLVGYHGFPFHENWGGFHWSGNYAFNLGVGFESIPHNLGKTWFPCVDNFTDRSSYDVYVTVSNDKKAVCGGTLKGITDNGNGTSTWHWNLPQEIPTYLASVAIGDYSVIEDVYYGIEDTIPIRFFVRPQDSAKVAGSFVNLKTTLQFFENKFGPYPFGRVGYVGTAIGAMEHATNIAYPNFAIDGTTGSESLYTHELSHMWFGDKITCDKAEEMWINEGWASFCEMYYLEAYGKHDQFVKEMRDRNAKVLQFTAGTDGGNYAVANVPQNVTYGSTSYDKGAVVVNTLRGYLGDSLFSLGVKHALQSLGYKSVNSTEWLSAIGEGAGVNLQSFLNAWVYTPGTPHFSIDSSIITQEGDNYKVNIFLRQKYKDADFLANDNILKIGYLKDDYTITTDTVHFSGKTGHSVKYIDFNPLAVMLDPFEEIDDATIDFFKVFKETGVFNFQNTYFRIYIDEIFDSAFVRVTHHWVAPDSLKNPVEGLRISSKRYWEVEGFFPENMMSRGKFYFSNSSVMDDDLQLTYEDSVMVLYRANRADDWHYVPQYLYGTSVIGYIYVEDLKPGEYTITAINKQFVGIDKYSKKNISKIYPNPTTGNINIKFNKSGDYFVRVIDSSGKVVNKLNFHGKKNIIKINSGTPGTYLLTVYKDGKYLESKKVILVK